jgi:hypothetical protein|tara:strand:- start:1 stop:240 length:240 start_codon:yes stop_codon:yes gene_type:complete
MRIGYKKFKEIKKWYGSSSFEIGYGKEGLTIRFGYWNQINLNELKEILPDYCEVIETEVDETEFGQPMYHYEVNKLPFH